MRMWSIMHLGLLALVMGFHVITSFCMPIGYTHLMNSFQMRRGLTDIASGIATGITNSLTGGSMGAGAQANVMGAANAFASDVGTVSSSLNTLGTTTDKNMIRQLATTGYYAEKDEDQHRAILSNAAGLSARTYNQKIVDNTPTVLNGLQAIMINPSAGNTMRQLNIIESARNAQILPSITQLSNMAFKASGVQAQAQTFQSTTGSQKAKALQVASGNL